MSRSQTYNKLINTSRWQKLRRWHLGNHPWCEDCLKRGVHEVATEVHHITPCETVKDELSMAKLMYDPANLVSLCHTCHIERHMVLGSRKRGHTRNERTRAWNDGLMERFKRKFGGEGEG